MEDANLWFVEAGEFPGPKSPITCDINHPADASDSMTLTEFAEIYIYEHKLASTTEEQYRLTTRQMQNLIGRSITISELSADCVNSYLHKLEQLGRSITTVRGRRTTMLVLWNEARRLGLNKNDPIRLRRIRPARNIVTVWGHEQVSQLLRTAERWIGKRRMPDGTDAGLYWSAYVAAAWDSGLRRGDLLDLKTAQISPRFWITQRKTGGTVLVELRASTIAMIDRLCEKSPKSREKPFGFTTHPRNFSKEARNLIEAAGLVGSLKYIRRGCATAVAYHSQQIGDASRKLGHQSEGVTKNHYLAPSWQDFPSTLPPELSLESADDEIFDAEVVQ